MAVLPSQRLLILACSTTKRDGPATMLAIERYDGPLWRTLRAVDPHGEKAQVAFLSCLLYTSPSPRDGLLSRMPSSA